MQACRERGVEKKLVAGMQSMQGKGCEKPAFNEATSLCMEGALLAEHPVKGNGVLSPPPLEELLRVINPVCLGSVFGINVQG